MDSSVINTKKISENSRSIDLLRLFSGYQQGNRTSPILIRLDPVADVTPVNKQPVRIYVGTESKRCRTERLFVWSLLQVRDPARCYEIYLMKDLEGFERRGWSTAYSGYRYAVPTFTNGEGRAIYNDITQIYFNDPAELFDCDMNGVAILGDDNSTSSMMLLDCQKLSEILELGTDASNNQKSGYFENQLDPAHRRELPTDWSSHDLETEHGKITVVYQQDIANQTHSSDAERSITADRVNELEHAANSARFTLFTESNPSKRYKQLLGFYETMHAHGRPDTGHDAKQTFSGVSLTEHIDPIAHLIKLSKAKTVLDFGSGKGKLYHDASGYQANSRYKTIPSWGESLVTCYDPGYEPFSKPVDGHYDVVISTDVVEHIPEEDISWVLDKIFAYANHSVYIVAACYPAHKHLPDGTNAHCTLQPPEWWVGQIEQSARHYPAVNWVLCTQEKGWLIFQNRKKLRKKGMRNRFFSGTDSTTEEYQMFDRIQFN